MIKFGWQQLLALAISGLTLVRTSAEDVQSVTLAWDPNPETDIKEYRLYIGFSSKSYGITLPVGLATTFTITDLEPGMEYYFALTAVNYDGLESDFSSEVQFSPAPDSREPGEGMLAFQFQRRATDFRVTLNGTPQTTYVIETSVNLKDWTVFATKTSDLLGLITVNGRKSGQGRAQFFRAVRTP